MKFSGMNCRMDWHKGTMLSPSSNGVHTLHANVSSIRMLLPFTRRRSHKNGDSPSSSSEPSAESCTDSDITSMTLHQACSPQQALLHFSSFHALHPASCLTVASWISWIQCQKGARKETHRGIAGWQRLWIVSHFRAPSLDKTALCVKKNYSCWIREKILHPYTCV